MKEENIFDYSEDVKKNIEELKKMAKNRLQFGAALDELVPNYILAIDSGYSYESFIAYLVDTLSDLSLISFEGNVKYIEIKIPGIQQKTRSELIVEMIAEKMINAAEFVDRFKGLCVIDFKQWGNKVQEDVLEIMLDFMVCVNKYVKFVFVVSYDDKETVKRKYAQILESLNTKILIIQSPKIMEFIDYSNKK